MRILITGGAGFVGCSLALAFSEAPGVEVAAFDNLRRRGSELNLCRLGTRGVRFFHGDIRVPSDLEEIPGVFDLIIDAAAEPSVHAGLRGAPAYVIGTNLFGTANCLEYARIRGGAFVLLSTSRVYSISSLRSLSLEETDERFELSGSQSITGVSAAGVAEDFPTGTPRSLYGASKLAAEMLVQEYAETYGLRAVINRCGVIAGPGQFGKVDQGVFTLWVAHHYFGLPLHYTGFGGKGKQVRDLLHPLDLYELLRRQLEGVDDWRAEVYNVGGGRRVSVSMREMTRLCREITGLEVEVTGISETSPVDIPLYLSDWAKAFKAFGWTPHRGVEQILAGIAEWIRVNQTELIPIFGAPQPGQTWS